MAGTASKPCAALGRNQLLRFVADREVAWQILALKQRRLTISRNARWRSYASTVVWWTKMPRVLSPSSVSFDEPALVTLGVCYERFPRFGGGAYHPILRRLEAFTDEPLRTALKDHEKRATMVLELEEKVAAAVRN